MIDLKQVLTGEPIRLRYIKRFSICPRVHEESVAEHSYYVAFIALMIAEDLKTERHHVDIGKLLSRALLHDLDEVFSGDFIRMFKHDNKEVHKAIDNTSAKMMKKFTSKYPAGEKLMLHWKSSKANDLEGWILSYADFLSVLSYIWQEIHAGNVVMFSHIKELRTFSNSFKTEKFRLVWQYHDVAENLLKELEERHANDKGTYPRKMEERKSI